MLKTSDVKMLHEYVYLRFTNKLNKYSKMTTKSMRYYRDI